MMKMQRLFSCVTGIVAMILLAESWLIAAGVAHLPTNNLKGGIKNCDRSDEYEDQPCATLDKNKKPDCVEEYPDNAAVQGQILDLLLGEEKDYCGDNNCKNIKAFPISKNSNGNTKCTHVDTNGP